LLIAMAGCASRGESPALARPWQPDTYLAEGQDATGTTVQRPSCSGGCPLNALGTVVLYDMTWRTWDFTTATGTGTETIQSCGALCTGHPWYRARVRVTLTDPVRDCAARQAYWTRATFRYPDGLGGAPAPPDPWKFTALAKQARQTCQR
jgi:hypothetical protein